ncbi:hypothetical protein BJF81_02360 [Ornithinimicrobium sp. CNJ-824]|uniref:hypothetical protein n=1 Tax=Ornithinimicrobium sp. CNJ-824 TaxID=1904966 RepID=UPI000962C36E|nr:hypothetical protein [Ornithinimicrobium sp. CNJ-824]OLT21405.1 hypothetical protein BJF81_02360 [Ornithinimicrobium sp. CNJ-824]
MSTTSTTSPTTTTSSATATTPATVRLDLAGDDVGLVVEQLREAADAIASTAMLDASDIVTSGRDTSGGARDPRTRALHLAQRLARAMDFRRIADELTSARTAAETATTTEEKTRR